MGAKRKVKPKWKEADALRRGKEGVRLGTLYKPQIEERLPPGCLDGLAADVLLLESSGIDRGSTTTRKKGRTGAKHDASAQGKDWVMAVRNAAKRTPDLGSGVRKSLGVGEDVHQGSDTQVRTAIQACFAAFGEHPELPRTLGLLESDLEEGRQLAEKLEGARKAQEEVTVESRAKTFDRDSVQIRVEHAVDLVSSRGALAFRTGDTAVRAQFEKLISSEWKSATTEVEPPPATARPGTDPVAAG